RRGRLVESLKGVCPLSARQWPTSLPATSRLRDSGDQLRLSRAQFGVRRLVGAFLRRRLVASLKWVCAFSGREVPASSTATSRLRESGDEFAHSRVLFGVRRLVGVLLTWRLVASLKWVCALSGRGVQTRS